MGTMQRITNPKNPITTPIHVQVCEHGKHTDLESEPRLEILCTPNGICQLLQCVAVDEDIGLPWDLRIAEEEFFELNYQRITTHRDGIICL